MDKLSKMLVNYDSLFEKIKENIKDEDEMQDFNDRMDAAEVVDILTGE